MGGKGGPYRLWDGNKIHQIPEEQKTWASEEAKKAAKEMAQKALHERLQQIEMTPHQAKIYESYLQR